VAAERYEEVEVMIGPAEAGVRLDRTLRKLLPKLPLSALHRMLRKGAVKLAGVRAKPSDRPSEGAALVLRLASADAAALRSRLSGEGGGRRSRPRAVTIPVIYEDVDVVAFDKPAGVAVQPGSGHPMPTTVLGALREIAGEGSPTFRPALVGRLDRDASGMQLGGRTPAGVRGLEELSRAGRIDKEYIVLVRGEDLPPAGRIDEPLLDRGSGRRRMAVASGEQAALDALTEFTVTGIGRGVSLVRVELGTGRRHQIRAHLASRGWPVAGDVRYGLARWNRELARACGLGRLFLHCAAAEFRHPVSGRRVSARSPLPEELARVLPALGIASGLD